MRTGFMPLMNAAPLGAVIDPISVVQTSRRPYVGGVRTKVGASPPRFAETPITSLSSLLSNTDRV